MHDIKSDRMAASWQLTDPVVYWGSEDSQFPAFCNFYYKLSRVRPDPTF